MQGREIDLEKLIRQNELTPAIGNTRVNARGDELGPGGKIIRSREEIVNEYYEPNTVKQTPAKMAEIVEPPIESATPEYYEGLDQPRPVVKTKKTEE
jgi:hypothetical protein